MSLFLTAQKPAAELTIILLTITDSELKVTYEVRNRTEENLYIFNKLYEEITPDLVLQTDKNLVNIIIRQEQVFVSKAIEPVPENLKVEYTMKPCVTKIGPLSIIDETFTVPLPLTPKTPYEQPEMSDEIAYKSLFFSVGYFVGHDLTESYEKTVKTPDGPAIRFDPFSYQDQDVLTVGPLAQSVPVFEPK